MNATETLIAAALAHHRAGRLIDAEVLYRQILGAQPGHADALHLLGVVEHQRDNNMIAAELIEQAISRNGSVPAFHNNHGNVLSRLRRYEDAAAAYRRAIQLQPEHAQAHYNLGMAMQAVEDHDNASRAFQRAIALQPDHADAHAAHAITLQQQGFLDQALAAIDRAIVLSPRNPARYVNRGNILRAAGRRSAAIATYRNAIALQPATPEAYNNLGLALFDQGDLEGAAVQYREAIALSPHYVDAQINLADTLRDLGRSTDAIAAYRHAIALAPARADARIGLVLATLPLQVDCPAEAAAGHRAFTIALTELETWAASHPGAIPAAAGRYQPFHLAYYTHDITTDLVRFGRLIAAEEPSPGSPPSPPVVRSSRVRIAIITAHLRDHPVWHVILRGWLARLPAPDVEIVLYNVGIAHAEQEALAAPRVARYVSGQRSLAKWRADLKRGEYDVILYPEVGMDPIVGALAAHRLAPVQAAGWGHPVTTGLPTIDIFLSGALLEPGAGDQHYSERLVRLPETGVSNDVIEHEVEPWDGPSGVSGTVRFALCQQPGKFDPADDQLIARIAAQSGLCEFWLVMPRHRAWAGEKLRARLERAFENAGLDPARYLRFTPWMPPRLFNGFLDAMDVYLDCPAFSGYTTALQAVQRGLPIVTLEGAFLRQRLAAGLLRQIGETDGIAQTANGYVDRAVSWADEVCAGSAWTARRNTLRAAALASQQEHDASRHLKEVLVEAVREARAAWGAS
ncbi:O-linked N-acetylglucosamine transferase, SPINDLY family protein [Sphingomonas sp. PAMC 26605]|uniref:O-linked N-acetylglucosamine transferase, SPINDLY family protein n=1 Tax=Sphingomonas sp. PAMC 26605 TaxID=1112214 RepID=UPI0012F4B6B4|nr:tetratricopeptide repeat protein [Sphingomonas sp. PAMC 26605]